MARARQSMFGEMAGITDQLNSSAARMLAGNANSQLHQQLAMTRLAQQQALLPSQVQERQAHAKEYGAQANYFGEKSKTESALRQPRVNDTNAQANERNAHATEYGAQSLNYNAKTAQIVSQEQNKTAAANAMVNVQNALLSGQKPSDADAQAIFAWGADNPSKGMEVFSKILNGVASGVGTNPNLAAQGWTGYKGDPTKGVTVGNNEVNYAPNGTLRPGNSTVSAGQTQTTPAGDTLTGVVQTPRGGTTTMPDGNQIQGQPVAPAGGKGAGTGTNPAKTAAAAALMKESAGNKADWIPGPDGVTPIQKKMQLLNQVFPDPVAPAPAQPAAPAQPPPASPGGVQPTQAPSVGALLQQQAAGAGQPSGFFGSLANLGGGLRDMGKGLAAPWTGGGPAAQPQPQPAPAAPQPAPAQAAAVPGGKPLDDETAKRFLAQAGGDANKARALATAAGYTITP